MATTRTLAMVMAGGKGSRLGPLTCHRAKPAVPFAGRYRIIDFVLSNLVNSDWRRIYVLTQYMASSLIKHLQRNWHISGPDSFIEIAPAQMRLGEFWYRGTADAVLQNLNLVHDARADLVAVFGGDHVYKMDLRAMQEFHQDSGAALTIAAITVPREEASRFGVIQVDADWRIVGFQEKPDDPTPIPGRPDECLVSMGNYIFDAKVLSDALTADGDDPSSSHDFGKDVIPALLAGGAKLMAWDFSSSRVPGEGQDTAAYWRDVGTIDSYYDACMDVRSRLPALNLYNRRWRMRTAQRDYPPARILETAENHVSTIVDSLLCEGSIVSGAHLRNSLIGYDCYIHDGATVSASLTLSGCDIGAKAHLHRVLLDKNCKIEPGAVLGMDPEADRRRFPFFSDRGIIVLPKGTRVPRTGPIELAEDMVAMLQNDPSLKAAMEGIEIRASRRKRHSFESAGPRFREFGHR